MAKLFALALTGAFAGTTAMPTVETAWSHAMDKNCCGGGEACGYVRFLFCFAQPCAVFRPLANVPQRSEAVVFDAIAGLLHRPGSVRAVLGSRRLRHGLRARRALTVSSAWCRQHQRHQRFQVEVRSEQPLKHRNSQESGLLGDWSLFADQCLSSIKTKSTLH